MSFDCQRTGPRNRKNIALLLNHHLAVNYQLSNIRASVLSLKFLVKIAKVQTQVLRLTTPELKSVWGPFRSATVCFVKVIGFGLWKRRRWGASENA